MLYSGCQEKNQLAHQYNIMAVFAHIFLEIN